MATYCPEVVHKQVENTENDHQKYGTPLCLEPYDNHDTCHKADKTDQDSPNAPFTREHKANEEKDQQDSACKLKIHFAVLFVDLG